MEFKSKYDELIELANKLFIYTDHQQWAKLCDEVFAEHILFDMSSLGAGEPKQLSALEICKMWETGFSGIDAIHHQSGNFLVNFVSDNSADIYCYAIAIHFKNAATKGKTRQFVGSYNLHAVLTDIGWRLDSFKYNVKFVEGNAELK
jgi:SnoaL-like domain